MKLLGGGTEAELAVGTEVPAAQVGGTAGLGAKLKPENGTAVEDAPTSAAFGVCLRFSADDPTAVGAMLPDVGAARSAVLGAKLKPVKTGDAVDDTPKVALVGAADVVFGLLAGTAVEAVLTPPKDGAAEDAVVLGVKSNPENAGAAVDEGAGTPADARPGAKLKRPDGGSGFEAKADDSASLGANANPAPEPGGFPMLLKSPDVCGNMDPTVLWAVGPLSAVPASPAAVRGPGEAVSGDGFTVTLGAAVTFSGATTFAGLNATTGGPGLVPSDLKVNSVLLWGGAFPAGFLLASAWAAFSAASAIAFAALAPAPLSVASVC